jgi:hypothetical protein
LERNVDAVTPIPPNMETRRKPTDEQLAHVLEIMLRVDPEKNEPRFAFSFKLLECFKINTFIPTTIPKRIAVIVESIEPITASSGK